MKTSVLSVSDNKTENQTDARVLATRINEIYHDLQAGQFDDVHRRRHNVERVFWESDVAPRLVSAGAETGVDLCSGTGFVPTILLKNTAAPGTILCIDLSSGALETAQRSLAELAGRTRFHAGDAATIPLLDDSADWVAINAGLHHLPDVAAVLKEVDRVLKPGGRFCVGHEPNAAFFSSKFLLGLERVIWHLFWYASPSQNIRRIRKRLGRSAEGYEKHEHLQAINEKLLSEGLVSSPVSLAELRSMVDIHTHDEDETEKKGGFRIPTLLRDHFPQYEVEVLRCTDYGGDMLRKAPSLRWTFDALMRGLFPGKGRLFSWILLKPDRNSGTA